MKKTFLKNLIRDIRKTLSRFLSIVIIIALGVSFYAGVRATSPDMKMSGDFYFSKNNLMDFKLISTLGLTKDDVSELRKIKGVTQAEGSYSMDAVIEKDKRFLVLNINSLPDENGINKIRLVKGRRAENNNEAVVEERFLKENKFKIGDTIMLQSGNSSSIGDSLKNNKFRIVGAAESPLYVSAQRQLSSAGNGSVKGFVYILPQVFKNDVYTEIYLRCSSNESDKSLLDNENYTKLADDIEKSIKKLEAARCEIRYAEVIKSAEDKIKDAEDKLKSSEKEAGDRFAEAHKKIDEAENEIVKGKKELSSNGNLFYKSMADGEKKITEGKNKIKYGEDEINSKAQDIKNGGLQIASGEKQLDDSQKELDSKKQQAAQGISQAVEGKVKEAKAQLDSDPYNPQYQMQYNLIKGIYEKDIQGKDFDSMYDSLKQDGALSQINSYFDMESLKSSFDKAESDISAGRLQLLNKKKQLDEGEKQLEAARTQLEASRKEINAAEAQLNAARQEGLAKLSGGRKKLEDAQKELEKNTEKLIAQEKDANSRFKQGEEEIKDNKAKLKDIKVPEWYVLGRSANVGYETYRQDSDRINNIGKAFPMIFFLVAALVSLTTMARMVQENRTEIGTFKALGYSTAAIVAHYLLYSLTASLTGSLIGISLGFRIFPPLIMTAYGSLYTIPYTITPFNTQLAVQSSFIAVLFTVLAAVVAAADELREVPASLMRPKPPKSGKTILLERIPFIWKRFRFTWKVTARNIFRYKQRFFMTVIGIAACTGLMITGFGLKSGVTGAAEVQFSKIYRYDMQTILNKNIDDTERKNIRDKVMKEANIKSAMFAYLKNGSVKNQTSVNEDAYVIVPESKEDLNNYINLIMKGKELKLSDDGVIITQKLSKLIDKKTGDTIELTVDNKTVKARITAITEHYVQHYVYISPSYYERITGNKLKLNSFYGLLKNTSESAENNTAKALTGIKDVGSVSFKNNSHFDMNKSINSINSVVLILIVSAGALAFVVIYNLTNININERKRELATIKLLGFYNNELASYIYRENIILTVIGSLAGIAFGILLDNYVISAAETNVMMFLKTIKPVYFMYSVILTISFSVIVNLAMYRRFDRIDMIESLKSAE